ncbi:hypothetical protein [cf. Phormidesmis sp. LEGE 11477]|uniref:hypothetical protein n=1 Tax=cf. Phormidesmis sp. LEGE 11477 TaxID=1828680 RepID=UPI00187E03DA|nr:hypothetical protein [cf. Phormidesmis sp. LEGE 11477]MBE9062232.1 hypothetical protein [cf. Phormidesmis sp. LEGE 11477]
MALGKRIVGMHQVQRIQRAAKKRRRIAVIAYQLYQKRMQQHSSGDEHSDWAQAQEIVSSPLRHSVYFVNHIVKAIPTSPVRWFASGVLGKTSWEWMELLLIPSFLAVGAFYLENQIERRQERIADERIKQETLTSYFEQMKELLLSENLRESSVDSEVCSVARALTTTTVRELGSEHNALLVSFLQESNLSRRLEATEVKSLPLLTGLDLRRTDLSGADLSDAD